MREMLSRNILQLVCIALLAVVPLTAFADSEETDNIEETDNTGIASTEEDGTAEGSTLDESVLVEISGTIEGFMKELETISSDIPKAKKTRLAALNQKMTSLNTRWEAFMQIANDDLSQSEVLLEMVSQYKTLTQATTDSLAKQGERVEAMSAFEKFEKNLPSIAKQYDKLSREALEFSLVPQTAQQLAKVKTEEQLAAQDLDKQYADAKAASELVPELKDRMKKVEERYLELKGKSEEIQAAEYKSPIERIKDYILTFAGVAIILMFLTMVQSKIKEIKAAREAAKKYKEMMSKSNNEIPTICLALALMLLTACNSRIKNVITQVTPESEGMAVSAMTISKDCRDIEMRARVNGAIELRDLADTTKYNIEVKEYKSHLIPCAPAVYPKLVSITSIAPEQVKKRGLVMHVLVDLTQSLKNISRQREYVKTIRKLFCNDNLFLTFMLSEGKVSPTMPATDYIVDNYISPQSPLRSDIYSEDGEVLPPYIYRSVSSMLDRLTNERDTILSGGNYKLLMLFTDGNVYDEDDYPIDPDHFSIQEKLIRQARNIPQNLSVYYLDLSATDDSEINENNMLKMLCQQSNGQTLSSFKKVNLDDFILSSFNIDYDDYIIKLRNPEEKYYFGTKRYINIAFTNKADSLVASTYGEYNIANVYRPKHIGDRPLSSIALQGIIMGLSILLLCYIALQIVWPFASYMWFRRRYVMKYTGPNMSVDNIQVPGECYLCKAPFTLGEKVVVKCKHVTHLECWNENGHRCPEHGIHCPEGSHYYNKSNIFDLQNSNFYMKWVLLSIVVSILSWSCYVLFHHDLLYDVLNVMAGIKHPISARLYHLPVFGFYISYLLTAVFSLLSIHNRQWYFMALEIFCRASVTGVLALAFFALECSIINVSDLYDGSVLFDFIPWTLSAVTIAFCSTWRTRLRPQKRHLAYALGVGLVSTLTWGFYCEMENVTQMVLMLLAYMVFGVGIAVSIAKEMPRSEHYFLHVTGPIKEMDIALYKWLRTSPNSVVTIGKSINCTLQITWDMQSNIAPLHAEIRLEHGVPRLYSVDGELYYHNRVVPVGKRITLYHGDMFQIGLTHFRYLET